MHASCWAAVHLFTSRVGCQKPEVVLMLRGFPADRATLLVELVENAVSIAHGSVELDSKHQDGLQTQQLTLQPTSDDEQASCVLLHKQTDSCARPSIQSSSCTYRDHL
jgi:hypothetical protein